MLADRAPPRPRTERAPPPRADPDRGPPRPRADAAPPRPRSERASPRAQTARLPEKQHQGSRSSASLRAAAQIEEIPRELSPIAVWIERLGARPQQLRDPLEVVEQSKLPGRVLPRARVVAPDPRRQRRERLDLDLVLPPAGADTQAVALAQHAHVSPQLVKPDPPRGRCEAPPGERPPWNLVGLRVLVELPVFVGLAFRRDVTVSVWFPKHHAASLRSSRAANHIRSFSRVGGRRPYRSRAWRSGIWRSASAATSGRRRCPVERL